MRVAVIGAGPTGLAVARALQKSGIEAEGYESSSGVGGLWDIENPRSTMYESAHLISSRTTTEFHEFPMDSDIDYPGHRVLLKYFQSYADHFNLRDMFQFDSRVVALERTSDGRWKLASKKTEGSGKARREVDAVREYDHVILANGTLAEPNIPEFRGKFSGTVMHTSKYKSPSQIAGKRVLVVGAGNSGCDIAVDAVHHSAGVDMSVRRGYYFVPRYIFGKPSDTLNQARPLPRPVKQFVDKWMLRAFTGNPVRFGFPKPNYRIYESHPIVNTMVLNHLGQGDLEIRADISKFEGNSVHFVDGSKKEYDLILLATGYKLDYPFVDRAHLNWQGMSPALFLNIFNPEFNGLYVAGMVEASGLGWQGRYEQAELIASYLKALRDSPESARAFEDRVRYERWPDVTGGYKYLGLERMSYYVTKTRTGALYAPRPRSLGKGTRMNPDEVVLSFTPGSLLLLNFVLGFIMLGIALDVSPKDFKIVLKHPKPFVVAIVAQLLVLPAVTFGLTFLLPVGPSMALGMILVASCPPGNISQVLTHRAGGNVALSVSMTAVGNLVYIFFLPLSVAFWGSLHPTARELLREVTLDPVKMLLEIFLIIGLPFIVGLLIRAKFEGFAQKVQPFVKWFSLIALIGFIVAALAGNWSIFVAFLGIIVLVVAVHDAVALAIGYGTAYLGGLGTRERKAMTFEVGIRNAGLGLGLVFAFFGGLGGMAIVAGWWGIWDIIAGLIVASLWAARTKKITGDSKGDPSGRSLEPQDQKI